MNIEHIPTRAEIRARRERLGCHGVPEPAPQKLPPIILDAEPESEPEPIPNIEPISEQAPASPFWFRMIDDRPVPTMDNIIRAVARYYGITANDIRSQSREFKCVRPRMVAVYIARSKTEMGFPHIGRVLGGRDHATVTHSFKKIQKLIDAGDLELKATVDAVSSEFAVPE
jgi:hypothetical protein